MNMDHFLQNKATDNRNKSLILKVFVFTMLLTLCFASLCINAGAAGKASGSLSVFDQCKADLAERLKLKVENIKIVKTQSVTWPSSALGMPEMGKLYMTVLTPGYKLILEAENSQYLYTTSKKNFKYGGPVILWDCSLLFIKPVANDPNLNGDLYRCSLMGTNPTRLVSGVTDFFPKEKGMVVIKRRTSRSSHDLLYFNVNKPKVTKPICSAFDVDDAAINDAGNRWAAFIRPMVGMDWTVAVGKFGDNMLETINIPLPDKVKTGRIAWLKDKLLILADSGMRMVAFETSPDDAKPEWKIVTAFDFPGYITYMLNKSESLDISQIDTDNKPGIEVARVWFTGERRVVSKIDDAKLRTHSLFVDRYAAIWGEKNSEPVFYVVDIRTGEVVSSLKKLGENPKPFIYAMPDIPQAQSTLKTY